MFNRIKRTFYHSADITRHWCPQSEPYAGGDALLTYLNNGWTIQGDIYYDEHWHGGVRRVLIYYFTLTRQGQTVTMPVMNNPVIDRIVAELPDHVLQDRNRRARTSPLSRPVH